jgi:hypothetical protein
MKTINPQREKIRRTVILPIWAWSIDVKETDTDLVVSGDKWWRSQDPVNRYPFGEGEVPGYEGIPDFLRGFDEDRKLPPTKPSQAPHLLFAKADSAEKQKEFVKRFGPILASKIYKVDHTKVIANQNLRVLNFEQKLYSSISNLTRQVNELKQFSKDAFREGKACGKHLVISAPGSVDAASVDRNITETAKELDSVLKRRGILTPSARVKLYKIRELALKIGELMNPFPEDRLDEFGDSSSWQNIGFPYTKDEMSKASSLDILERANGLLCNVFNRFPTTLVYAAGFAHDMPVMERTGIRPILYYMLRLDYLYQREIKLCARPNCGGYFVPDRKDRIYCSNSCSNSDRQRRFQAKSKAESDKQGPSTAKGNNKAPGKSR